MTPPIQVWAKDYIDEGYEVVPLAPGTKACKDEGWLKLVFKPEDFDPQDNLGIRSVKGLRVVDLDCPEANALADIFLPHTGAVYGRPTRRHSKRMFICEGITKTIEFKDAKGEMLLEVRAEHQDLAPPSRHPDGEVLEWVSREKPSKVEPEILVRPCRLLASTSLIAQNYNGPGDRHKWTLALAGSLRKLGLTQPETEKVIEAAAHLIQDLKVNDRLTEVRTTYAIEDEDEGFTNFKDLKKLSGRGGAAFVRALQSHWPTVYETRDGFKARGSEVISSRANIERALEKLGVTAYFDAFSLKHYVTYQGETTPLEDKHLIELRVEIDKAFKFLPFKDLLEDLIKYLAWKHKVHPVRDYLDGLSWDGVPRLDTWLTTYFGVEDTPLNRAIGAIVLMGLVRRVRQPGCKFDEMLILYSPKQGTNKSLAVASLCPNQAWFSDDLPLGVDAKQVIERTGGKWIIEAGELVMKHDAGVDHLKQFMSRQVDGPVRPAYARQPIEVKRQFLLIGTTNNRVFLKDSTGNRRFWPVEVGVLNLPKLRHDRDQLWAEASQREAIPNTSIRLDKKFWVMAEREQLKATREDPWANAIENWLVTECLNTQLLPITEPWKIVDKSVGYRDLKDGERLDRVMQALGYERRIVKAREEEVEVEKEVEGSTAKIKFKFKVLIADGKAKTKRVWEKVREVELVESEGPMPPEEM